MSKLGELQAKHNFLDSEQALHKEVYRYESEQISKQRARLLEDERKIVHRLGKEIKKRFRGIKDVRVNIGSTRLNVNIANLTVLSYTYNEFKFNTIEKELALDIKDLYDQVYGEPIEEERIRLNHCYDTPILDFRNWKVKRSIRKCVYWFIILRRANALFFYAIMPTLDYWSIKWYNIIG